MRVSNTMLWAVAGVATKYRAVANTGDAPWEMQRALNVTEVLGLVRLSMYTYGRAMDAYQP